MQFALLPPAFAGRTQPMIATCDYADAVSRHLLHDELVARLRYFDGHSDTLGLFADAAFLRLAAAELAEPFRDEAVTKVVGVEARGFVLATAVALELGAGFAAVRKAGGIHPGPKEELRTPPDWRGDETLLRIQRHAVAPATPSSSSTTGRRPATRR